jgi:anti-anti-sigma regulatory factor
MRTAELGGAPMEDALRLPAAGDALRDLWGVLEAHYEEVTAATMDRIMADGVAGPLAESIESYRQTGAGASEESREQLRAAMVDGAWDAYVVGIRELGAFYAREGLAFRTWPRSLHAFWAELRDQVVITYEREPQRAVQCMSVLQDFVNLIFVAIAEEYLEEREATIRQQERVRELSTPVLPVMPGLLVLPVIGIVDQARAAQLGDRLLAAIRQHRARVIVLDVTGLPEIDTGVANHLMRAVGAARLMGARAVLCGLSTANAIVLSQLSVDLAGMVTAVDLMDGIRRATAMLERTAGRA